MNLPASHISAAEDASLPEARLEVIPRRVDATAEMSSADAVARLDFAPQQGLQPLAGRIGTASAAGLVVAALGVHAGLAIVFALFLNWRDVDPPVERDIPVEVVARMPGEPNGNGGGRSPSSGAGTGAGPLRKLTERRARPSRKPRLRPPSVVAPPPEPARAATQADQDKPANIAPEPPKPAQPAVTTPPVQAPKTVVAARSDASIAPSSETKPAKPAPPKPAPAQAKPNSSADLGAALPMDLAGMPTSFRAVLSGSGSQSGEEYKGLVFGRLGRSSGAVERARAQHLRGQVIVSFSVDDQGQVADLKIVQSSGVPAVDWLALDMVREAAPFPPPPPGITRTFTPALSFGDE